MFDVAAHIRFFSCGSFDSIGCTFYINATIRFNHERNCLEQSAFL